MTDIEFDRYIMLYRRTVTDAVIFIVKSPADAEDIAQDVFLKLYTYRGSFESDEHVKAWLIRCAINRGINLVRSYRHRNSLPLEAAGGLAASTDDTDNEVTDAVMSLDPKFRAALYLHYYEGYTAEETGKLLGISTATVKWRLKRGREKLKVLLEDERS